MPPKENLERACEECIHYWACSRQCGEPMAQSSATGCECYETVKSIAAASLIEQMNAESVVLPDGQVSAIESLLKEIEWKDMVISLAQRKQADAEAERDAALADLADARSCKNCKYACETRDCSSCKSKTCKCRECHLDKNAWEWRGAPDAPEEGGKA